MSQAVAIWRNVYLFHIFKKKSRYLQKDMKGKHCRTVCCPLHRTKGPGTESMA